MSKQMVAGKAEKSSKKKPYVKPELDSATVYEASGTTCCKTNTATCASSTRYGVGKSQRTLTGS
jgi:hypothetical protein